MVLVLLYLQHGMVCRYIADLLAPGVFPFAFVAATLSAGGVFVFVDDLDYVVIGVAAAAASVAVPHYAPFFSANPAA